MLFSFAPVSRSCSTSIDMLGINVLGTHSQHDSITSHSRPISPRCPPETTPRQLASAQPVCQGIHGRGREHRTVDKALRVSMVYPGFETDRDTLNQSSQIAY